MNNGIHIIASLFIIILLTPQTHRENLVLRKFHESGLFRNYGEAKSFLYFLTWFSIFIFILLLIV